MRAVFGAFALQPAALEPTGLLHLNSFDDIRQLGKRHGFSDDRFLLTRFRHQFAGAGSFSRMQNRHQIGERQRRELAG